MKKFLVLVLMMAFGVMLVGSQVMGTKPTRVEPKTNQSSCVERQDDKIAAKEVSVSKVKPAIEKGSMFLVPDSDCRSVELPSETRKEKTTAEINAEASLADSLCAQGKQCFCGMGALINREHAKKCFEQAEQLGSKRALVYLGLYYCLGPSMTKDMAKAEEYFKRAMPFILDQVGKGEAEYECLFGYLKEHGLGGQLKNIFEATAWYRQAALKGNADALNNLGLCYHLGKGVPRDYSMAKTYYEKAVVLGNITACYNLGCFYDEMKCYIIAAGWFRLAAERGHAKAQNSLGECFTLGKGVFKNDAEAIYWYKRAASQGDDRAQFNLKMIMLTRPKS